MTRSALPMPCPQCGRHVPRAAARRCPLCHAPFDLPFPAEADRHPHDPGGRDGSRTGLAGGGP
ncbi:hypothetical protein NM680_15405 [Paracoccus sp. PS-1]|uniref:hypothetical protein n=1 Tax=unclassified Paracoccus (in: a-proteobacteria) TaxID=2688777 RepID=UPI0004B8D3CF|nr:MULTISPECIES: hypothetical protein [unclassified Paracoccus (in: a-proteobacteria)]MDQ7263182.1 hypothetical protein [Paracoccus sp. PS1]